MRIGPLGLPEIIIILIVVLLIFGPRRLPEMAKGIGQSVREFRKGIRDMKDDFESEVKKDDEKKAPQVSVSSIPDSTLESERAQLRAEQERLSAEKEAFRMEREKTNA